MTGSEQREAARQFINRWRGKGKEDEDGRSYWIELLSNVFGVENVTERIDFEKKVVVDVDILPRINSWDSLDYNNITSPIGVDIV